LVFGVTAEFVPLVIQRFLFQLEFDSQSQQNIFLNFKDKNKDNKLMVENVMQERECADGQKYFQGFFFKGRNCFSFKFHKGESPVEDTCKSIFWNLQKRWHAK
jgi:ABC-type uncharacterized transport system substrate-binding protein